MINTYLCYVLIWKLTSKLRLKRKKSEILQRCTSHNLKFPSSIKLKIDSQSKLSTFPIVWSICKKLKGRGLHTPKLFYYLAQKYGAVCHLWLGPVPTILISDSKLLREAFKSNFISSRPVLKPFHEFRYGSKAIILFLLKWMTSMFQSSLKH